VKSAGGRIFFLEGSLSVFELIFIIRTKILSYEKPETQPIIERVYLWMVQELRSAKLMFGKSEYSTMESFSAFQCEVQGIFNQ